MAHLMRVSLKGAMPTGEEWSVNPVYGIGGDFGVPVSSVQAQTIATAIAALTPPTGIVQGMSAQTTSNSVRVEARTLTGTLESQADAVKPGANAGTGTSPHPFQTSQVVSLRTGTPGPSGRGRLYFPATGRTLTATTLRPSTADVVSFLSGAKTYLSAIEAAIETTLTGVSLCVWSRKLNALYPVTSLQAGDILDVQRRRRDTLIEGYSNTTYP